MLKYNTGTQKTSLYTTVASTPTNVAGSCSNLSITVIATITKSQTSFDLNQLRLRRKPKSVRVYGAGSIGDVVGGGGGERYRVADGARCLHPLPRLLEAGRDRALAAFVEERERDASDVVRGRHQQVL